MDVKADPLNAEYILVSGANSYAALQPGVTSYGSMLAERYAKGEVQLTIVDPRATNASAHAHRWLAVKPRKDGALAMGLIRWIIDNKAYDEPCLAAPGPAADPKAGRTCHSNASHISVAHPSHPRCGPRRR